MTKLSLYYDQDIKAIKRLLFEYRYDWNKSHPAEIISYIPEYYKNDFQEWIDNKIEYRCKYIMVTVNFKNDIDLNLIKRKVSKALKKIWIERYMYCYEVRSENEGIHIHMKIWLKKNKSAYDCKREMFNTFKSVVGNKLHINVRYSNRENCFEDYIKGFKRGVMKKDYNYTVQYRKDNNLKDIYCS